MTQWLICGMVYLGSALMVCNIWCFGRFARFVGTADALLQIHQRHLEIEDDLHR